MGKGARLRLTVDRLDAEGLGVAESEGLRVHLPYALPGEVVDARIVYRSPHRPEAWAQVLATHVASPDRVAPRCAAWGRCGGCVLQHLASPAQLAWKRSLLAEAIAAAGLEVEVGACVPQPGAGGAPFGHRNQSKLVFARQGDRVVLGAYAPRSHRVIDLAGCAVAAPPLDAIAQVIAALATRLGVRPHDERSGEGEARYALLRVGEASRVVVMLVVTRRDAPGVAELARALPGERPEVSGVVENLQPARGNVLVGAVEPDRVLAGSPDLIVDAGVRLRLSPRAFFQSSTAMAARLYADAARVAALEPGQQALDLYSGVGGIALHLALGAPGAQVIGVEEVPESVVDARASAAMNDLANVRFVAADVAPFLRARAAARERTDVAVLDPPRKGLDPTVIAALLELAPARIVYVSCAPDTLARDLAALSPGYRAETITPYDLAPHTPHVEAIAALRRR